MGKCIVVTTRSDGAREDVKNQLAMAVGRGYIRDDIEIEEDWHTPHELYEHRYTLFRAMIFASRHLRFSSWRAPLHHDGTMFENSFIVGVNLPGDDVITYHLPLSWWEKFDGITTYTKAPEWDGVGPEEGLVLLNNYIDGLQKK